jgi:gamma-glutamyltranspeptidase/glutathione hydrolase
LFVQSGLRAWFDRARWLTQDLTANVSPVELISEARLNSLMASYRGDQRTAAVRLGRNEPLADNAAATSFITVDRDGNAVVCETTAYGLFGAGKVAAGTGVVLPGVPDGVRGPQCLGPMMVTRDAETRFTLGVGASGGSQFIFAAGASGGNAAASAIVGVALRALIERQRLEDAVDAPRIHYDGAPMDAIFIESGVQARPPGLVERGYALVQVPVLGRVNAAFCPGGIKDEPASCQFRPDRRGFGLAAGGQ